MKKNYLFPHYFQWIGWVIAIVAFVALVIGSINCVTIKMPALYLDVFFDDDHESGFFKMAETGIYSIAMPLLIVGMVFIGFSKEKVEDEFVQYLRSQSLIWSTYVTAALFILATLLIYGINYLYVPYLVFFVFLLLFVIKFKTAMLRFKKGGER